MKTLLVPIDFTPASENTLRYLEQAFKGQDFMLELLHISPASGVSKNETTENTWMRFERIFLQTSGLNYQFTHLKGEFLSAIRTAITKFKPFALVVGTQGKSLVKSVIQNAECPVLVIPPVNTRMSLKHIAYTNDNQLIKDSSALRPLLELSRNFQSMVHIIHINNGVLVGTDQAEPALEYYLDHVDHDYATINNRDMVDAINDYVRLNDIDLLAVLLRDHGKNSLQTHGELVAELVNLTNIPVLSLI